MKRPILQLAAICSLAFTLNSPAAVHYVDVNSTNPISPYAGWSTAATNIQDAVDATSAGDQILVTNGIYATGGRTVNGCALTNRVAVTKPVTLQSVNGPAVTIIQGNSPSGTNAVRCVYLTAGAACVGFTLTNGATLKSGLPVGPNPETYATSGGGVWCESTSAVVSNCTLIHNSTEDSGGGAYGGTLNNCTLTGNQAVSWYGGAGGGAANSTLNNCTLSSNAANFGGGACTCTLNNCLLTDNSASAHGQGQQGFGGGANGCTLNNCTLSRNSIAIYGFAAGARGSVLNNCVIYYNTNFSNYPPYVDNYDYYHGPDSSLLNFCCTAPIPAYEPGTGNFTNAPLFVDIAHGNLHLQSNSPCINAGDNSCVIGSTDLDCRPRIVGGKVDVGAYEFQGAEVAGYINWLQQYILPTDSSSDFSDFDHDGLNNWQEWKTGTNPTNTLSVLEMASATATNNPPGLVVTWQSVSGIIYFLQSGTNLGTQPAFSTIQDGIAGQAGTTSYTDTNAIGSGPFFYRVGVQ